MINTSKIEILVDRIINDYDNGYCPLHFEGPICKTSDFEEPTSEDCKKCIMRWLSTI